MDFEQFDKWSGQFQMTLAMLKQQEKSIHSVPKAEALADSEFLSQCETQICATKELIKMTGDLDCLTETNNNKPNCRK